MKFNMIVPQADASMAYNRLKSGVELTKGNVVQIADENITYPAHLCQEQAFVATANTYTFQFGNSNPPSASSTLNNVILGQNNAFVMCGVIIMLGYGANANNRKYYSRGTTNDDNSLYNAELSMNIESNQPVQKWHMRNFYEEGNWISGSAYVPIKPLRVLTGLISRFEFQINFINPITTLTLSSNLFISVHPVGALGLA